MLQLRDKNLNKCISPSKALWEGQPTRPSLKVKQGKTGEGDKIPFAKTWGQTLSGEKSEANGGQDLRLALLDMVEDMR